MQLWDDLVRDKVDVYIIGATNRPQDVDPAFLRRFERSFLIGPPDLPARKEVLQSLLGGVALDPAFDFDMCAWRMEGYTPSDMIAVCRAAMLMPAQEARKAQQATSISDENGDDAGSSPAPLRPLRTQV